MKTRKIGPRDVSGIGLGCMGMSIAYGERDEPGAIATIRHALDQGVTFIDTADVYGNGHNEELLSRALEGRRHEATLATKFGVDRWLNSAVQSVQPFWGKFIHMRKVSFSKDVFSRMNEIALNHWSALDWTIQRVEWPQSSSSAYDSCVRQGRGQQS